MLVIGHRGSAGTKPENSIAGLREAIAVGADMIEVDVRITKDKRVVLAHDWHMFRQHRKIDFIRRHTLRELKKRTAGSEYPVVPIEQVLKECAGNILLNIELKERGVIGPLLSALEPYLKEEDDWDNVLFSAFNPLILRALRKRAPYAALSLLHYRNPLNFMAWHRILNLSAVGFHRLYISSLSLEVAKRLELFTYAYTINRADAAEKLIAKGIDGIVTDYPGKFVEKL
jgi:glycerophosphoryl diester phosphodiesterase